MDEKRKIRILTGAAMAGTFLQIYCISGGPPNRLIDPFTGLTHIFGIWESLHQQLKNKWL
jgi:hypothetical protein